MEVLQTQDLLSQAKSLYDKQDWERAQIALQSLVEHESDNADAYFYLGNVFHLKGDLGKAVRAFQKVLELNPTHTEAAISLSVIYNDIGKYEEAQRIYSQANERILASNAGIMDYHVNQKFALKHFELGEQYYAYQRFEEALFEYNKAANLDPNHLPVRLKLAQSYSKKGLHTKAIEELKRLKVEHPEYEDSRIALGLVYYTTGNVIDAEREWNLVLEMNPENAEAKMYLQLSKASAETILN